MSFEKLKALKFRKGSKQKAVHDMLMHSYENGYKVSGEMISRHVGGKPSSFVRPLREKYCRLGFDVKSTGPGRGVALYELCYYGGFVNLYKTAKERIIERHEKKRSIVRKKNIAALCVVGAIIVILLCLFL